MWACNKCGGEVKDVQDMKVYSRINEDLSVERIEDEVDNYWYECDVCGENNRDMSRIELSKLARWIEGDSK